MRAIFLVPLMLGCARWATAKVNFKRDVAPILETRCIRCHGPDRAFDGVRLDEKLFAMLSIVPKNPEESIVYNAAKSGFMPPAGPRLTGKEVETLRKWIAEGAHWPKGVELPAKPSLP